jgi:lipoteichoic acid synthase
VRARHRVEEATTRPSRASPGRGGTVCSIVVWAGIGAAFLYRAVAVQGTLAQLTGCRGCFYLPILHHDALLLGALVLLYAASLAPAQPSARTILARAAVLAVLVVYGLDLIVWAQFFQRLKLADVLRFGPEIAGVWSLVSTAVESLAATPYRLILATGALAAYGAVAGRFLVQRIHLGAGTRRALLAVGVALVGAYALPLRYQYVHAWTYKNVVEVNLPDGAARGYSAELRERLRTGFRDEPICEAGLGRRPNVIVVVVESLSLHHSRLFSGIHDYTPRLDAIAERHTRAVNFFANGFTSEGALIALLTGTFPLPWNESFAFGKAPGDDTLPKGLRPFGYTSYFFTTADLSFAGQREWLERVGFDVIEGAESSEYDGWKRRHFNAAPDEALYRRALRKVREAGAERFVMVLETVSSHHPPLAPDGGAATEENVMRYVDEELGKFYGGLVEQGFFEDGLLIVTSDHRAMTPITRRELEAYGPAAAARLPLVIVWPAGDLPGVIAANVQQVDLLPSVKSVVAERFCRSPYQGHFLRPHPAAAPCVLHARGDERDQVYVRCGDAEGQIKIDGDRTRVVSGEVPDAASLIDKIAFDRLRL